MFSRSPALSAELLLSFKHLSLELTKEMASAEVRTSQSPSVAQRMKASWGEEGKKWTSGVGLTKGRMSTSPKEPEKIISCRVNRKGDRRRRMTTHPELVRVRACH